jgi:putative RecB family exonuclease
MAFRFASIQKLPETPSPHTTKGSLVHRALELLFTLPRDQRTAGAAATSLEQAVDEFATDPEMVLLGLDDEQLAEFRDDAWSLVQSYLRMEDPRTVHEIGLELRLEAEVGSLTLRGIIDRLELDAQGRLIVTDYKTGRSPGVKYEQSRLAGVQFYSFLCESVLGQRPAAVRLMYLRTGEVIEAIPSAQSVRFITTRATAVWRAVEKACLTGDFRPRAGALCSSCSFRQWCPAFGGDPEMAAAEAPLAVERLALA